MQLSLAVRSRHLKLHKLQQYRYNSSTPGPLEARRRASKRRYAGTASSFINGATADDFALPLGLALGGRITSNQQSTPAPVPVDSSTNRKNVWSWLEDALEEVNLKQANPDEWKEGLLACQTTHDIEQLAKRTNIWLADGSTSRSAFEHLCAVSESIDDLLLFLDFRHLNPPEASNLSYFLQTIDVAVSREQTDSLWTRKTLSKVTKWLKKEVVMGNLSERDIRDVARWATPARSQSYSKRCLLRLVDGLLESTIRPPHQLQRSTIRCVLRALPTSSMPTGLRRYVSITAKRMILSAPKGTSSQTVQYLEAFLQSLFRHGKTTEDVKLAWRLIQSTTSTIKRETLLDHGMISRLTQMLQRPPYWRLLYLTRDDTLDTIPLSDWKEHCRSMRPDIDPFVASARPSVLCTFLDAIGPISGAKFLANHWIFPGSEEQLDYPVAAGGRMFDSQETLKEGLTAYMLSSGTQYGIEPYLSLLGFIKTISNSLAEAFTDRLIQTLLAASRVPSSYLLYQHARRIGISLLPRTMGILVNRISANDPTQALALFTSEASLRIENCLPLAAAIMATPSIPTETILTLLSRSMHDFKDKSGGAKTYNARVLASSRALLRMLAATDCPSTARLALVSRMLEIFDSDERRARWPITQSAIQSEVINSFARGDRMSLPARDKVLARASKMEGPEARTKLERLIDAWEGMEAPLEGNFNRRDAPPHI